jgi:hypothetical protein
MHFDCTRRDYLLPPGCKDLIDAINPFNPVGDIEHINVVKQGDGLMLTLKWPNLTSSSLEIVVEGRQLSIARRALYNQVSRKGVMDVPADYDLARASATYIDDTLRIFVPTC